MRKKTQRTHIGGQAVIQGVMMLSKCGMATAVRDDTGEMQTEAIRLTPPEQQAKWKRLPFVRGVVSFVSSLVLGMGALMRSSDVAFTTEEEEPSNLSKWMTEKLKVSVGEILSVISTILGVVLALALFLLLPNYLTSLIADAAPAIGGTGSIWYNLIDGGFRLVIFLCYILFTLLFKSLRETYQYHGAEHKTINCYEYGDELTVENVKKASRLHDRCGTTFIFLVLIVSILIFALVNWALGVARIENGVLQFLAKLGIEVVLLPVIAGISYEILKLVAKFDGKISLIFKAPGFFIQKVFTTREPDEEMAEVAIAAFEKVLEMDADPEMPETEFITGGILSQKLAETKKKFSENGIDESDAEWIYSLTLYIKRSELSQERMITPAEAKKIAAIEKERLTGRPLWYIIGDVDFCGCKIKVDERVLIPRPETEQLAEIAIKTVEEGDKVLDMCTGSGCLAIAIAKGCSGKNVSVTAADVSDAALMLAKENANYNSAVVHFIQTDLFENIRGRFNVIVCNPPYIKSSEISGLQREVREYEPRVALDGGDDGLDFYRRLSREISRYIAKGGMLILEVGEGQAAEVLNMFEKRDYAMVVKDYQGVDRILKIAF